jgi:hypothetical protein
MKRAVLNRYDDKCPFAPVAHGTELRQGKSAFEFASTIAFIEDP